jgi:hypothetical protein
MQPMDTQGRRLLAAERFEVLRDDARSSVNPARRWRARLGGLLGSRTVKRPLRPEAPAPGETASTSPRSRSGLLLEQLEELPPRDHHDQHVCLAVTVADRGSPSISDISPK